MSKFAEFAETKKFKTIMNYIYSLGAAVVIAGALFKIQHWPGANLMLNIGMGTEVFVFCIFAIDPTQVHMDLDWCLDYPEVAGMHGEETNGVETIRQSGNQSVARRSFSSSVLLCSAVLSMRVSRTRWSSHLYRR